MLDPKFCTYIHVCMYHRYSSEWYHAKGLRTGASSRQLFLYYLTPKSPKLRLFFCLRMQLAHDAIFDVSSVIFFPASSTQQQ